MDGEYVRNKLKKSSFQLKEIAEKLNMSQQNLNNKLNSKDLKVSLLFALAKAINENVYYFFGDEFDNAGGGKIKPFTLENNETKNAKNVVEKNDHKNDHIFDTKPKVQKTLPFSGQNLKYSKPSIKEHSVAEPIPFYDVDFVAGEEIHTFDTQVSVPDDYYYISELNGCTAFRAYSDSMEKLIKNGATLFATNIENWFEHLEYGNIYGIVCNDGRKYLKYIRRAKEDVLKYLLRSENEDYDDFDIPKSEIRSIWLIHAWINRKA